MNLYLVRHGQRGKNEKFDTLTKEGIWQSKRLGPYFKDKKIDYVYVSPQKRAQDTLKHIIPYLNKNVKIDISESVKQQGAPAEVEEWVIKKYKIKNETDSQTKIRTSKFLKLLKKKHKKDNVLIVTHKRFATFTIKILLNLKGKRGKYVYVPSSSVSYFKIESNKLKDFLTSDIRHLLR